jgi:hypothetical protein
MSGDPEHIPDKIEITPEMIEAGTEAISRRWGEFTALSGYRLMDEVLREVFSAMLEAHR